MGSFCEQCGKYRYSNGTYLPHIPESALVAYVLRLNSKQGPDSKSKQFSVFHCSWGPQCSALHKLMLGHIAARYIGRQSRKHPNPPVRVQLQGHTKPLRELATCVIARRTSRRKRVDTGRLNKVAMVQLWMILCSNIYVEGIMPSSFIFSVKPIS